MWASGLRYSADSAAADWVRSGLGGRFGCVSRTIPSGYDGYVRICHAAPGPDGPVRWAQVAEATGRRAHALMQWHALIGSADSVNPYSALWPQGNPEQGNLDQQQLQALCSVLAASGSTVDECYFCLWDGYGWISGSPAVAAFGSSTPIPSAFPTDVIRGPRVHLPGRDYLLFAGPLAAAIGAGWHVQPGTVRYQSPNLFWPADRTWCVATEIDFDSTLVAGSSTLIERILATPELDAWPIDASDSLAYDADVVNCDQQAPLQ